MKVVKFVFSLFGINTYVVYDESTRKCAIIDPGMIDEEEEEALSAFIKREGLTVEHIINTHLHVDHAVGDKYASEVFKAPVLANRGDETLGKRMREQAAMFGIAERVDNVSISSYLQDGDTVEVGKGRLHVLHVPGHSPGSIALYDADGGYVIAGDALFAGSIGRTDLPGGSMPQLLESINTKLMTLPDRTIVYPGHGPATTIANEKRYNPFLK